MRTIIISLLTLLWFSGCTMIPNYQRPEAPMPEKFPEGAAAEAVSEVGAAAAELPWREFIQDVELRQLIELSLANNRDLRLAALNVEQVRALYKIQREEMYPSLYASGSGSRQSASRHLLNAGQERITETYRADLSLLSWEIDFFGRLRSLTEKAMQEYFATEQARRGAQILLISTVANGYLALAADRESLALAEDTFQSQQEAYQLVERQYRQGLATELDLRRAQIPREAARGDMARYRRQAAVSENLLRQLVGASLPEELLPQSLGDVSVPAPFASGLSSKVLLQRPDILAAEHQLRGALAMIGVARAAFFPNIVLIGNYGTASTELSRLFEAGATTWGFSPQLSMPIFDARTWSAYRVSKVQREMALTQYEKAIQNAFRETADSLALCATIGEQLAAQKDLVEATAETYRLARFRYEKGIDNYLSVLDAQRTLFSAQQGLVSLKLAEHSSRLQLYAVLGGGAQ
ncbi:MAG: efflux transporter outer membrane subunit [Lentisphaeria bacterium]|nr:efflux transporter outer membrane subunit [Lentisphaeria bacterium]